MAKKTHKKTVMKAHKIARAIGRSRGVDNVYAVGMAAAKKAARKRKRS
jgi:hypothetical protein